MSDQPADFYERFYARGGWGYDLAAERRALQVVARVGGWAPGDVVTEVGAGMGHHAELLRLAGYRVSAVEASAAGAAAAAQRYPHLSVVHADAAAHRPPTPGHVYARGMSWWHYNLDGTNRHGVDVPAATAALFDGWVGVGRTFVLQIVTDLSGRRPTRGVHHNRVSDYRALFAPLGPTVVTDWAGQPIVPGRRHDRGVLVATRKAGP